MPLLQPPTNTTQPPRAHACTASRHASGRPTASNTTSWSASRSAGHRSRRLGLRAALGVAVGERDRAALGDQQRGEHLAHRAAAEHADVGRDRAGRARGRSRGRPPRAAPPSRRRRARARPGPRAGPPRARPSARRSRPAASAGRCRSATGRPGSAGRCRRRPSRRPAHARRCPRARRPSRGRSGRGSAVIIGCPRCHIFTSVPQVVAASIRTSTSPGPGTGSGTSRTRRSSSPNSSAALTAPPRPCTPRRRAGRRARRRSQRVGTAR